MTRARNTANRASWAVTGIRCLMVSATGWSVTNDLPRSPVDGVAQPQAVADEEGFVEVQLGSDPIDRLLVARSVRGKDGVDRITGKQRRHDEGEKRNCEQRGHEPDQTVCQNLRHEWLLLTPGTGVNNSRGWKGR